MRLEGKVVVVTGGRRAALAALLLAPLLAAVAARAQPVGDAGAAAAPVMKQLEAFRRDDYDLAYTFASESIQGLFDRRAFERMVKRGYPEIARSTFALVAASERGPDGHVLVRVKVQGVNGHSVEALYDMVQEVGGWRINGVTTRPDAGLL